MSNQEQNWPEVIEAAKEKFLEIAPRGIEFIAERAFAVQILKNNDFLMKVAKANPTSLQSAILNVAAIGLSLNPAKAQAYLVPRSNRVCLDPSYRGMVDLVTNSGSVKWIQANTVHTNDSFTDNGPGNAPEHKYNPFAKRADRGEFAGVYCVAKTADGDFLTTIMTAEEVNSIKQRSETGKKGTGPWVTDFEEMAKKSVIRRAFKTLPKTETLDRMAAAVELSNSNEGFEPILTAPALGEYTPQQKQFFDQLLINSDGLGMFIFQASIDERMFTNLYHSFPKGEKGKYQGLVKQLLDTGSSKAQDYEVSLKEHASAGNDYAIAELLEGMSQEGIDYFLEHVDQETAGVMREVIKKMRPE